ncbi:hypothetical protein [Nocardia vulneris]|uniref:Uncharacterized protein n=1 Tax=Nocardia vulneris TaxID=1141657 RepID=A0ABR4Z776_9NOCA|nr:hypothetical protein [Nocardia vulneris]KIA61119.1 hypothetical protein FG87_32835 [Nocardia vulneris]
MQLPLLGSQRTEVEAEMEALAARCGGTIEGRLFCEAASPVAVLWSLVVAVDERSNGWLMEQLREAADRTGVDLARLVASAAPVPAFMAMLDALSRWGGEYVIAPSPAHFDGLGAARKVVLERISQASRSATVEYVDPLLVPRGAQPDRSEERRAAESEVLDEDRPVELGVEQIGAYGLALEVIGLSTHRHLARAGLGDLIDQVDALLGEVVRAALRFTARANLAADTNRLTVRWLRYPDRLLVTLKETRDHADPISVALRAVCDRHRGTSVGRDRCEDGGTLTWFELPLPHYRPPGPSVTRQVAGGVS